MNKRKIFLVVVVAVVAMIVTIGIIIRPEVKDMEIESQGIVHSGSKSFIAIKLYNEDTIYNQLRKLVTN